MIIMIAYFNQNPWLHFVLLCGPGDHGISFDQLIKGPVDWGPKEFVRR